MIHKQLKDMGRVLAMSIFSKRNRLHKKNKLGKLGHIGVTCIVIIAALSLLGAAYASWSQTFSIFGSVNTGNLNVVVRDITLESSDGYETCSFNAEKDGNVLSKATMNVITKSNPFQAILVFTVENNGTLPVTCVGIDKSIPDNLQVQLLDSPDKIEPAHTGLIKVKLIKGYCKDFEFSSFLRFVQAT